MARAVLRRLIARAVPTIAAALVAVVAPAVAQDQAPAPAGGVPVDIELVLAVDASLSIDAEEAQLQRQGYYQALTDPKVIQAIQSGPNQRIALFYFEWASEFYQRVIVDWTVISDGASARAVAEKIASSPYRAERRTSISGALRFASGLFGRGYSGERRVIDVSGDGCNNSGPAMEPTRDEVVAKGIVINGLPILNDSPNPGFGGYGGFRGYGGYGCEPVTVPLDRYYQEYVVGGPGAFSVPAEDFESFDKAILSKLIREISGREERPTYAGWPTGSLELP
ncbi:MAG TPA: DUF1194 domain-containing protein [Alphaproteobacteria bacterium]|jgi:hypothetical protein|nr:DUF1194 domain-containing protein [Alphaproteobacteria bacterium]